MIKAEVHSDSTDGSVKTITLTATGPSTGHITIADTAGSAEDFDLFDVAADPAALKMTCQANVFVLNPHITITVKTGAGKPIAVITIDHVFLGGGTTEYPLREGEDGVLRTFLQEARFPPLQASA